LHDPRPDFRAGGIKILICISAWLPGPMTCACYYEDVHANGSTMRDVRAADEGPAPLWGRRIGILALAVIVVLGALGLFGVRSRTVEASAVGYTMRVTYPQTARAGLDVPWRVEIRHPGGFGAALTLAVSADYFRMFETQGFYPTPDHVGDDGSFVYMTFDNPVGDRFVLDYDAYIQPAAQIGKSATVKLIVDHVVMVQTHLETWLLP
jgi:hypothetical protein